MAADARPPAATFTWEGGVVSAGWHGPAGAGTAVVLAHGAGKDLDDPLLVSVAGHLAEAGIAAVRFNFPYREAGRAAPGSQREAEACYRAVAAEVATRHPRLVLGGKSYGGRMASHIVADGVPAAGLVFLGYPLHPPGRPEKIRDAHLYGIEVPMLFCQGARDPFATPELLRTVLDRLPRATLVEVAGGGHSFEVRGRRPADVRTEVAGAVAGFVQSLG